MFLGDCEKVSVQLLKCFHFLKNYINNHSLSLTQWHQLIMHEPLILRTLTFARLIRLKLLLE